MTTVKDRFARWTRSQKENAMSTEQIEQNDIHEPETAQVDLEAGTEAQDSNA